MQTKNDLLYPNIDIDVWTRSCGEEVTSPIEGKLTGCKELYGRPQDELHHTRMYKRVLLYFLLLGRRVSTYTGSVPCLVADCSVLRSIPPWLRGSLLRNGPGTTSIGSTKFNHLFDCSALMHRFAISDSRVTYQCRFLRSDARKRNQAAGRIVVGEFGTEAVHDPCRTIFDRVSAIFNPRELMTDNSVVSFYPFGDQIYAFSENPFIHRIDPETLKTMERKNLDNVVVCHTSHPHVMPNGDVYNAGISTIKGRIRHVVVKFPNVDKGDMFEKAYVVGSMSPRWSLHPSYMHSFGITENYFVLIEQPLSISLRKLAVSKLTNKALGSCLQWYPEYETHLVLICRKSGKEVKRYQTETLFFVHIVNCFEKEGVVTVDLCSYKDAKIIDGMYLQALENMQSNPDYAEWFRSHPKRIELPLDAPNKARVEAVQITEIGCELPRINYEMCNGKPYRYFYAISSELDSDYPGALIKVDTKTGKTRRWCKKRCYASEPIFVPALNAKNEDDGVLLSALLWGERDSDVSLLVLDASDMSEIARADFTTPSSVPKDFHGWFLANQH